MSRSLPTLLVLASAAGGGDAGASPDREVIPARRIERTLELAQGWTEVEGSSVMRRSSSVFGSSGQLEPLVAGPWVDLGAEVRARHGWDARTEVFGWASLSFGRMGGERWSGGPGAFGAGVVRALVQRDAPLRSAVASAWVSGPPDAGDRAPTIGVVAPGTFAVPGLGGWGGGLGLAAKRELAPLSIEGAVAWSGRGPSGRPLEVAGRGGAATGYRLGDALLASGTVTAQIGPLAPFVAASGARRGPLRLRESEGLMRVDGTSTLLASAQVGVEVHATRAFDIRASRSVDAAGAGSGLIPLAGGAGLAGRGYAVQVAGRF